MKKIRFAIQVAAFLLAIGSAAVSNARQAQAAASIYGYSYFTGQCMEGAGPLESECSTTNTGTQCTVLLPTGEPAYAFTTQLSTYSCFFALKRRI